MIRDYFGRCIIALTIGTALATSACARGTPSSSSVSAQKEYATRTAGNEVQLELTPRGLTGGQFIIDVRVNTHSGDLSSLNLQQATTLSMAGTSRHPASAGSLQGHHASASLSFPMEAAPDAFEVVISGVRSEGDLHFRWP
jgi:hypothetical protein